jgi:Domain of unknown function (DU1801)
MARRTVPRELIEFLAPFSDDIQEIALDLRTRVLVTMPKAHEVVWDATNAVSLVYTPSTNWQDGVVHIAIYAKRVNLGFNDGASLADTLGVLTGTGTRIRHASFRSVDEVGAEWVDEYVAAALEQAGLDSNMGDRGTTIRVSKGPKRRPG